MLSSCARTLRSLSFLFSISFSFLFSNAQELGLTEFYSLGSGEGRNDDFRRIRQLNNGDLIIAGVFRGTKDFDPGVAKVLRGTASNTTPNGFISRYTPEGELVWVRHIRCGDSELNGMDIDADGNIYVVGYFNSLLYPDESNLDIVIVNNPEPNSDIWMLSYTADGDYRWGQMIGDFSVDNANAVLINGDQMIVAGLFSQTVDLDPGPGVFEVTTDGVSGQNMFVASYNKDNGSFNWGFDIGGSVSFNRPRDLALDDEGNFYLTGAFRSTKDFNPDPDESYLLSSSGNDDYFIASYTSAGAFRWANRGGAGGADTGMGVRYKNGVVYTTGEFRFTSNFSGNDDPEVIASNGNTDIFVASYNAADGALLSLFGIGGAGNDSGQFIDADDDGNVYLTGAYVPSVDFNPNGVEPTLIGGTNTNGFVASYDQDGILNWVSDIQSAGTTTGFELLLTADQVSTIGEHRNETDFDPSENEAIFTTAGNSNSDFFFASYAKSNGGFVNAWSAEDQVGGNDVAERVRALPGGGVVVAGTFVGTLHYGGGLALSSPNGNGVFIVKYDDDGNVVESRVFSATTLSTIVDLEIDDDGFLYFAGNYSGTATLEGGGVNTTFEANGNQQRMLLIKFNSDLEPIWEETYSGDLLHGIRDIALNGDQLVVAGFFRGTTDFADGISVVSNGVNDGFVMSMDKNTTQVGWAFGFGANSLDSGNNVGFDSDGNILLVASIRNSVSLDPAGQADPLPGIGSDRTAFASYTPDGVYRWAHLSTDNPVIRNFTGFDADRIVVYGSFSDGYSFGYEDEQQTFSSEGNTDAGLLFLSNMGDADTTFTLAGGSGIETAGELLIHNDAAHLTGTIRAGGQMYSANGVELVHPEGALSLCFYAALNLDLEWLEGTMVGVPGSLQGNSLTIRDGEVYVAGSLQQGVQILDGTTTFSLGGSDAFFARLGVLEITPEICLGDFNDDGAINAADLVVLLSEYACTSECTTDITGDGIVDINDVLLFLTLFGTVCD